MDRCEPGVQRPGMIRCQGSGKAAVASMDNGAARLRVRLGKVDTEELEAAPPGERDRLTIHVSQRAVPRLTPRLYAEVGAVYFLSILPLPMIELEIFGSPL